MANVEETIKNMLKVSLKKQIHSTSNNNNNADELDRCVSKMLRVKYEYHEQTRALSLSRPVKFEELYLKIHSSLDVQSVLTLHYINPNKEIFGQISNQAELEQIVQCVDRNSKYRSLRILVTANSPPRSSSATLASDRHTRRTHTHSHTTRPDSPPPGSLHPNDIHMERSTSFPTSHVDGEFIPEDDAASTSQSGDSSYSSSRQSLLDSNWTGTAAGTSSGGGGGSGRRAKLTNLASHSEMPDNERRACSGSQQKIGTFPMRVHPSSYAKPEGRQTLPHMRNQQADAFQQQLHQLSSGHNSYNELDALHHHHQKQLQQHLQSGAAAGLDKTMTRARVPSLIDYKKGPLLGRGGFGQVYKCLDSQTGREFAMKEVLLASVSYYTNDAINKDAECLENEINIYRGLMCHQRIVQYFGAKRDQHAMYIFMEYMAGGSVKDQLRQYGPLPHNIIARYSKQIFQGLAFLHQKLIIHRDVKAANILRDIDGNVKLSDFGASRYLKSISIHNASSQRVANNNSGDPVNSGNNNNNNNKGGIVNSFCGTFFWMAPEVIRGESYSISADIWSMGSTVVEMLTGNPPYHDMEPYAALFRIANTNKIEFQSSEPLSAEMQSFIDQMFISNPHERATAETLLRCGFLASVSPD